eukprot:scaffold41496_cov26-Tisochrysis_lutea.AAC.5
MPADYPTTRQGRASQASAGGRAREAAAAGTSASARPVLARARCLQRGDTRGWWQREEGRRTATWKRAS